MVQAHVHESRDQTGPALSLRHSEVYRSILSFLAGVFYFRKMVLQPYKYHGSKCSTNLNKQRTPRLKAHEIFWNFVSTTAKKHLGGFALRLKYPRKTTSSKWSLNIVKVKVVISKVETGHNRFQSDSILALETV
jgi:hypothetical protein